jgi:hypothetical protein
MDHQDPRASIQNEPDAKQRVEMLLFNILFTMRTHSTVAGASRLEPKQ